MIILQRIREAVKALGSKGAVMAFGALLAFHFVSTYIGMDWLGEIGITDKFSDFLYWYVTTTTTVGYGDISPQTDWGRTFAAAWVLPGGICLLSLQLAWLASALVNIWGIRMNGKMSMHESKGVTVVVGWNPGKTDHLLELLRSECEKTGERIVLCDSTLEKNPMPGHIDFVRGDTLLSEKTLIRAGVEHAKRVLIFSDTDEQALSLSLLISKISKTAHVVAHFSDSKMADLAKQYIPALEIASSMTMEMLARSACDPGTSDVIYELLSINMGATLFRYEVKPSFPKTYGEHAQSLRTFHNATLIALRKRGSEEIEISPPDKKTVYQGDVLFYIASERLSESSLR